MNIDLTGKIALVTGASRGIGRAVAIALASCGAKVAVNYLSGLNEAQETAAVIRNQGGEAIAVRADVTRQTDIETMMRVITETFGGTADILVNNAGHMIRRLSNTDMTEEHYNKVMDVNMKSAVLVSKAVIPGMTAKGSGCIVNMTSLAAHNGGGPGASIYAAAKAAMLAYTKGLAKELAPLRIRANAVSPGFIGQTAFHATFTSEEARKATVATIPLGREGSPEDVAGAVLFLVSELSSYITGETIEVNGGMFMR